MMNNISVIKGFLILVFIIFIQSTYAQTYKVNQVPNDNLSDRYDFVTNPNGIISSQAEQAVNSAIIQIKDSTSAEVAVVLLKSIGDEDIDNFATTLFTRWGIGQKENDNGLLFLLVEDQRQMVFRTGYGLEGVLPDIILSRIIRNDIVPDMKQGNYDRAIVKGMNAVKNNLLNPEAAQEILAHERSLQQQQDNMAADFSKFLFNIYMFFAVVIFFIYLFSYISKLRNWKTRSDQYNVLNAMKSGIILWAIFFPLPMILLVILYFTKLKSLRDNPPACPGCSKNMVKLNKNEALEYLTPSQRLEENIGSVNYDVWYCEDCKHSEIIGFDSPNSRYIKCPHCHAKTYYLATSKTIQKATSYSRGKGERIYKCLNCKRQDIVPFIIPMIIITSSSSSGRSSRGGFGGGSFGGGGGRSGGGFGGGRTGGGGARGGW